MMLLVERWKKFLQGQCYKEITRVVDLISFSDRKQ